MKRAPIIPKSSPSSNASLPPAAPAAPMVDSLIARVGSMSKGNSIVLPVCGRDVKFLLETVAPEQVKSSTSVWEGNERVQDFLTEDALDDLLPSFLLHGQQTPAFGRRVNDLIEVADGSRRRMTAILAHSEYRVLVGELDNEQMDALCKLGNDYRPTSAYERGRRYEIRLRKEFGNNISALADAEGISRKIITRCINTSKLPDGVIALFSHPGELSARSGEQLFKAFSGKEELLHQKMTLLAAGRKSGLLYEADEIIQELTAVLTKPKDLEQIPISKETIGAGVTVQYKGNKIMLSLDRTKVSDELLQHFEELLKKFKS